ncbi:MAG: branched-chain amino acid ABC transporter permease [Myxococcota bacterium]|nr:branched-chain amino acid ABC transporter permease [Myxococcota bacterium]MDW8361252.1 branched-chain amino acid ABC transporter permease [Myxococcales bacterium]
MSRWLRRGAIALLVVALCWGLDRLFEAFLVEYAVRIVIFCGLNAILAVGLNLINGTTGQFSIGHAGFMAVGAYGGAYTVVQLETWLGPSLTALPTFAQQAVALTSGVLVGATVAAIAGFLVGVPSLRLRGDYLAIVTLGFGEIIRLLFNNSETFGGATGYSGGRPLGLTTYTSFFWVALWAVIVVTVVAHLTRSSYGRALRAIREDEIAAEAVGLPTTRLKVMAFVVSAAAAGIAGALFAHLQSAVRPDDFKLDRSVDMIVMIIVGGLGSVTGAVLGGIFVAVTLELFRQWAEYRLVAYALLLVVLMIVRPQGLLGTRELDLAAVGRWWRARRTGGAS